MSAEFDKAFTIFLQVQANANDLTTKVNPALAETKAQLAGVEAQAAETGAAVEATSVATSALGTAIAGALSFGAVGAVLAGFSIIGQAIRESAAASAQLNKEIQDQSASINDQVPKWFELAQAADTFSKAVKLGDKIGSDLGVAAEKLAQFRKEQIGFFATMADTISRMFTNIWGGPGVSFFADRLAAEKADAEKVLKGQNAQGNQAWDEANANAESWARRLGEDVAPAIDETKAKIQGLTQTIAELNKQRFSPDPVTAGKALADLAHQNDLLQIEKGHLDDLTKKQQAQSQAMTSLLDKKAILDAQASNDPEAVIQARVTQAIAEQVKLLHEKGYTDEQAKAAADAYGKSLRNQLETQRALKAAGGGEDKSAQDALTNARYRLADAEATYKAQLSQTNALEQAGDITVSQGDAQRRAAILTYIAQLKQVEAELPKVIALEQAMGNTKGVAQLNLELIEINKQLAKQQTALSNTTFFGKLHNQLQTLINDWSDMGKQVGGFLTNQFQNFASGAGNAISGLIFRTQSWGQAIVSVGESFVSSLATMVIQWVLARTVISALNKAFGAADAQATSAQATAAATAWAPAGIAASIASAGIAAGAGLASFLAAIGIGTAGAAAASAAGGAGGFEKGGLTPGRPTLAFVGERGPEFVFSAPAVRHFGVDFLNRLHNVGVTRPAAQTVSAGGRVSSSARSSSGNAPVFHLYSVNSHTEALRAALNSYEGEHIFMDFHKRIVHRLKRG